MVYCVTRLQLFILIIILICSLCFQIVYALCFSLLYYDLINVTSYSMYPVYFIFIFGRVVWHAGSLVVACGIF